MAEPPHCPYCDSTSYRRIDQVWLVCKTCQHEFDIRRDLCRACGSLNRSGAANCQSCQAPLTTDTVDKILDARLKDRQQWQKERLSIATKQKQQEAVSSEKLLQAYWQEEQERQQVAARALAERREKEKRALVIIGIATAVIVTIIVVGLAIALLIR